MQNNNYIESIKKDEVNLGEIFTTINRYKWSILFFTIFITFIIAIKVYFMPKYYESKVTIEVKPEEQESGNFSIGGAAAMFLGGGMESSTNLEKDMTLLKTYRTNKDVLDFIDSYMVRYFITNKKYKSREVDSNLSIKVTDVTINNFKNYGMSIIIKPLNKMQYQILIPGRFSDYKLGTYHYSEIVHHQDFSLMIHKKRDFNFSYTIKLAGNKRYIYEKIINQNLHIKADEDSPFITLSFLDNLPHRGESYLKSLIETYTKQSINDIKADASHTINSYNNQIKKIEARVTLSSNRLEKFKNKNSIIEPEIQAIALVQELSNVGIEIAQNKYKVELLGSLIQFTKEHKNIDAIAPSLIELNDLPTMELIKLIQEHQISLSELLMKYKPDHPLIIRSDQNIYNLKKKVLSNLTNLQKTLKSKTKSLKNMEKGYNKKLKSAPTQEQKLLSLSRDYQVNEKIYLYIMQERSAAQLKYDRALSRFKIIESIYTSKQAVKPKKALMVTVVFIIALLFSMLLAFFREFMKKNKRDE